MASAIIKNGVRQEIFKYDIDDTPVNGATDVPPSSNWAYDHVADLDAHTYEAWQVLRTGEYYAYEGTRIGAVTLTANTLYAMPFHVPRNMTFDRIAFDVDTLAAGKVARAGIYENGTNLYPGDLVVDGGELSVATIGVKAATISASLTKGIYWLVMISDGTPVVHAFYSGYQSNPLLGLQSTSFTSIQSSWEVAQAYGALPDPFTAGGSLSTNSPPLIALRLLSLD